MKQAVALALAAWLLYAGSSIGQPDTPADPETQQLQRDSHGDRIVLRSGKSLQGVRVLSHSQIEVKVEVLPGLPPLILPASQVVSIQFEQDKETESYRPDEPEKTSPPSESELLPARKIDPEFSRKLSTPMAQDTVTYRDHDVISLLETIAGQHKVSINVSLAVRARPEEKRRCTVHVETGQSLHAFLHGPLTEAAPWLKIEYNFDTVEVSLKPR